ncbi:MAG: YkoF family thiamine/hydroxymethylpyrimidine-binding protein [Gammaproteobacteria bacterium]|nr:YkoF family thiamine/hydroxymethylpyrimidine-binding protein [Gammaproteobacteria bacterium]
MKASVDISLYPLADDYIPAIKEFIERVQQYPDVAVVRNDLSTQLYGDYEQLMDLLKVELRLSWENYGKSIFVIKFLRDDLRGLASD